MNHTPACLACGQPNTLFWAQTQDYEYQTSTETFQFYRCTTCQALSIHPLPQNRLGEIYPENYYSFSAKRSVVGKIKDWLDRRIFRKLLRQLPNNALSVLDIGGGSGSQLDVLKSIDARITQTQIVDLDPKAEKLAKEKGHDYFCGPIENFVSDKKFDLILLLNLIEHVANPQALLIKLHTLLSPNGMILVKTPNTDSWDATLFRHLHWGGFHCPRHWVLFTRKSFEHLVKQANLQITQFSYTQGAPFWAISILSILREHGWIKTSHKPLVYHPLFAIMSAGFAAFDFIRRPFFKTSQMFFILKKK